MNIAILIISFIKNQMNIVQRSIPQLSANLPTLDSRSPHPDAFRFSFYSMRLSLLLQYYYCCFRLFLSHSFILINSISKKNHSKIEYRFQGHHLQIFTLQSSIMVVIVLIAA